MGFVQLSDDLTSWEWFDDKNTVYVYVWLMLKAAWCDTRYHGIELKRGQAAATYPEISEKCGISIQQARTILDRLKTTGKATVKITPKFSIITMLEYDCNTEINSQCNSQTTVNQQPTQQSNNSPTLLNTNNHNIKQPNNALTRGGGGSDNGFEKFWSSYPKKAAKQQALKAWEKLKPNEELTAEILASLERQKKSVQWTKDNGQYIPYPATWLNGKRWEDELQEVITNGKSNGDIGSRSKSDWLAGFE